MNATTGPFSLDLDYLPTMPKNRAVGIGCIGAGFIMADCHLVAYRQAGFNPVAIASRNDRGEVCPRVLTYRMIDFLAEHFASARAVDRDAFEPSDLGDADVVLLDWSQMDVNMMDRGALASPLGARGDWSTPTVLLGSAGLLTAKAWQINSSYG